MYINNTILLNDKTYIENYICLFIDKENKILTDKNYNIEILIDTIQGFYIPVQRFIRNNINMPIKNIMNTGFYINKDNDTYNHIYLVKCNCIKNDWISINKIYDGLNSYYKNILNDYIQ